MEIIGIDFGTCSFRTAVMVDGKPQLIKMGNGKTYISSAIAFDENRTCYIGEAAENILRNRPDAGIRNIKQFIGKQLSFYLEGITISIYQIIAIFFLEIKRQVQNYLGETIHEAIVAVPDGFDYFQRQIIIDSGQIAGLKVLRTMSDSSAFAMSCAFYGYTKAQMIGCDCGEKFCVFFLASIEDGVAEIVLSKTVEMDYEKTGNEYILKSDIRESLSEFIKSCNEYEEYKKRRQTERDNLSIYMSGGLAKNFQAAEAVHANHLVPLYNCWDKDFVAKGAALQGGKCAGNAACGDILSLELWTGTLFLKAGEKVKKCLTDNITIPVKKNVSIECSQSESICVYQETIDKTKRLIAAYDISGINEDCMELGLSVDIDANRHLALDIDSSAKEKGIRITGTYGGNLSEDEISKQKTLLKILMADNQKKNNKKKSAACNIEEDEKNIIIKMLPVLDSLERGVNFIPPQELNTSLGQGFCLTYKQMKNVLRELGVEEIKALGEKFNPQIHDAVACRHHAEEEKGTITAVYEKGYMYKGKVLRFSKVEVNN